MRARINCHSESYYKAVAIPAPEIHVEMGNQLGLSMRVVRREAVRTHLGTISPIDDYAPGKVIEESVVLLR